MLYGIEQTVTYIAWDRSANAPKTGDVANHTLRWIKNGTSGAPSNAASEVDATNAPGVYKITLTAAEWQTLQGTLAGVSSTSGVSIIPQQFTTVRAPNADPGSNGGLGTVNASNQIAGVAGTIATLDALDTAQDSQHATTLSKLLKYFQLLFRKDAAIATDNATELTAINADGGSGGGTADNTTDSVEAIRDRGDAAWATGTTFGAILRVTPIIPQDIGLADTASYRLAMMLTDAVDDLPSTAEITPGTISIDRKAPAATSWTSVVSDAACSEAAGMVYYDEVFDDGTGYAEGDELRITFKSQKITVGANDHEITDATGRIFYTRIGQQALTAAKLGLLTSGSEITIVPAINDGDVITIYQGETRTIHIDIDGTVSGQDLTGLEPRFALTKINAESGTASLEVEGTLSNAGLTTQYVEYALTAAQTAALALNTSGTVHPFRETTGYAYRWEASATDEGTPPVCPTIASGKGSVKARGTTCAALP